ARWTWLSAIFRHFLGGNRREVAMAGPRAGVLDQVADEVDRLELRIGHVQAGGVAEEIEDAAALDRPLDACANRPQEPVELPAARTEGADVANRAHRHFDQAAGIGKWLGGGPGLGNVGNDLRRGLLAGHADLVSWIFAADPGEAEIDQHFLQILAVGEAIGKASGRAEAA